MNKKLLVGVILIVVIVLAVAIFWWCQPEHADTSVLCQVRSIEEDGLILYMPLTDAEGNRIDHVYVKNVNVDFEIQPLDTLVLDVTFEELTPAEGTFKDYFEIECTYSHILEHPKSIRLTIGTEPTYA